jgi:NAD-dependent deacetylase
MYSVNELFELIRSARYCIALTGAGVSTLSGIPDFRGAYPGELLNRFSPEVLDLYLAGLEDLVPENTDRGLLLPEKVFDPVRFEENPAFFYQVAGPLIYEKIRTAPPSIVHRALAEMEKQGLLKALITQNIDILHQKAGSRRVIELHGSPAIHYCLRCPGIRLGYDEAADIVGAGNIPRCPHCNRALKPGITFYGDMLPLEERRKAEEEAQTADLMLILGTSLTVNPAAQLPRTVLRRGGQIVIVNRQNTILDDYAILRYQGLEETFTELKTFLY